YIAFGNDAADSGVWITTNSTAPAPTFTLLTGGKGITSSLVDPTTSGLIGVNNNTATPSGRSQGRIVLAKPALVSASTPNAGFQNTLYEGWLYALVATTNDNLDGLYLTKDFGANWTKVSLTTALALGSANAPFGAPTNDPAQAALNITGGQGNYNLA